ncbi:unnamed protein product, partial [Rotaria sordida]
MIHVLQGRDFPGLNINPYVSVQIDDQKRYTNIQKSSNSPYFGEFFTFDFKLPATKFMEKVIFIKVHDAVRIVSTFTDTAPIGIFRLDLATVYNEKGHAFERKWAQLSNPENIAAPCGHLLLSISVTQRGVSTRNVVSEEAHEDDEFKPSESNPSAGFLPTLGPTWMFLYGSPREYTISKDKDGLSEGMGEAVCYKGRILMAIECHPVTGENTPNMNIQKETGIEFPAAHIFPMKRSFLLFGCIYDVSMIDKSFGSGKISFELSIGPSGYLNPQQLAAANHNPVSSLTRAYPCISIDNNKDYFRLPIDLQKPILFTKYIFHDYIYRMTLSNRLKYASEYL